MLLIGSRAARFHYPEFRKPKDYDFIATTREVDSFLNNFSYRDTSKHSKKRRAIVDLAGHDISFEFDLVEHYPSSNLLYKYERHFHKHDSLLGIDYHIASPQSLFLLKKSHITFNIHWQKNIYDYLFLQQKINNIALPTWWEAVYRIRFEEVQNRISRKQMNFDVENSEFFRKSETFVNRIVEHDSLHYATCFYSKPLFLSAKEDLTKAALSENKVSKMSAHLKVQMIQEECMALALEREIVPAMLKHEPYNAKHSYQRVACKMVYNYLPMFLRHFAADHFLEILDLPIDYVSKCLEKHPTLAQQINN